MNLSSILDGVTVTKMFQTMYGTMVVTHEVKVGGIRYDSRAVRPGDAFVAIHGGTMDGHAFIPEAIGKGATVVVLERDDAYPDSYFMHAGVVKIVVPDTRVALATMAGNMYAHPSRRLRLVGVTGTNGKTTTTHLIRSVLEAQGETVGLIGTIGYSVGGVVTEATHTTPEAPDVNGLLDRMVAAGCTAAVMEVSSHALALRRVHGLRFAAAAFTNLTQDHLDFHGSMEEYCKAKKTLFDNLDPDAVAVTNGDDAAGERMVVDSRARSIRYALKASADVAGRDIRLGLKGTSLTVVHDGRSVPVATHLIGRFNVQNVLAAYATGVGLGIADDAIVRGIGNQKGVNGRFEQIPAPAGWTAVIDYAHTPDALENSLTTIRELLPEGGRIITVFGCGGNRDKGKRPVMGTIASTLSDITVVTSDNPRHEKPESIIDDILRGVDRLKEVHVEPDRRAAIRLGLERASRGDVVLIAGKGHERYQIIGDGKMHFDDHEEVQGFLAGTTRRRAMS